MSVSTTSQSCFRWIVAARVAVALLCGVLLASCSNTKKVEQSHINTETKFSSKEYGVKGSPRITTARRVKKGGGVEALDFLNKLTGGPLTFGRALRAVREREELTQVALAERMDVGRQTVCDLEQGRRLPSPGLAAKYAKALRHHEGQFVRLALQDQVRKAGLKFTIKVEAA